MAILLAALLTALVAPAGAARADMTLILQLDRLVDDTVETRIALFANDIDPNSAAVSDRYRLEIDGRRVRAPVTLLAALDHGRRGYSYSAFTKGIVTRPPPQAMCMLGGPAVGEILSVRYLTYRDSAIVASEMRPVLSAAGNCLFDQSIHPRDRNAEVAAAKAMATLAALRVMLR